MLRSMISYAAFAFLLIARIPMMLWVDWRKAKWTPEQYAQTVHCIASGWAKALAAVSGARLHVTGLDLVPRDRAVLYVSNHESDFDIVVCLSCLPGPFGFVAKIEMLKVPLLRGWMRRMRCVFMDRKDMRQSLRVILAAIDILKSGHSMVVYPEGTRAKADRINEFKAGSFKLATKSNVPIVPMTISGSFRVVEGNHYKIKPADVYVTIHPPIYTDTLTADEANALPEKVKSIIATGLKG